MDRPGSSLLASVLLHAGVIGAVLLASMFGLMTRPPLHTVSAVPVQIVSDQIVLGRPGDEGPVTPDVEEAATAPIETPPEPTPPTPQPAPKPPERTIAPKPTPTPTPPARPRPTPPRPAPTPRRAEPSLDLSDLQGPTTPGPRRPRAQSGGGNNVGTAPQTMGPEVTAMFQQIIPNWILPCDVPGARNLRIQMDVTLGADGRITSGPILISPRSDPVWRAAADGATRALRQTAPFRVPRGFTGGSYRPTFNTEEACRNR